MAQIHNSDLTKELTEVAKLQIGRDIVPNQIADKIVPVIDVNPWHNKIAKPFSTLNSLINQLQSTAYTCSSVKDTYLTGVTLSMIKDATSTATDLRLTVVDEFGGTQALLRIAGFTLTAQSVTITHTFPNPLKLKKGSSIMLLSDTNVANITMRSTIQGFEIDNTGA